MILNRVILAGEMADIPLREGRVRNVGSVEPSAQINVGGSVPVKLFPAVAQDVLKMRRERAFSNAGTRFF